MNDPMEHATGLEKRELLAKAAGNEDPFDMHVMKRAVGAKDSPTLIPSAFDARIVGCVCKCEQICGRWRLITDIKPPTLFCIQMRACRPRRPDVRPVDVAAPGSAEAVRVRLLVQVGGEGARLKTNKTSTSNTTQPRHTIHLITITNTQKPPYAFAAYCRRRCRPAASVLWTSRVRCGTLLLAKRSTKHRANIAGTVSRFRAQSVYQT